jgi:hypothetical protein
MTINMKTHLQTRLNIGKLIHSSLVLMSALFLSWNNAKGDGVILIKAHHTQSPQYWAPFAFRTIEGFPSAYVVSLTNGQQRSFRRDEIGAIIEEPKWQEMTVVSDADWQKLEQIKTQLVSSSGQYPQLKDWANLIAAKFDAALARKFSETVIYRGKAIAKADYDKMMGMSVQGANSGAEKGVRPELVIGTVKLINAKLASFNEHRVSISHSGGIQGYNLVDLKDYDISALSAAFPEFSQHVKKLKSQASASNTGSKMNSPSDSAAESITLAQASILAGKKKDILNKISNLSKEISDKFDLEDIIESTQFPEKLFNEVKTFGEDIRKGELRDLTFTVNGKLSPTKFPNLYEGPVGAARRWQAVYEIIEHGEVKKSAILRFPISGSNPPNFQQGLVYGGFYTFLGSKEIEMKSGFVEEINFYKAPDIPQELIIRNVEIYQELKVLKSLYDSLENL